MRGSCFCRTPRHPAGSEQRPRREQRAAQLKFGTERLRLGIVVAELQRQGAEDRRLVQRQLDHLERRLQVGSVFACSSQEL